MLTAEYSDTKRPLSTSEAHTPIHKLEIIDADHRRRPSTPMADPTIPLPHSDGYEFVRVSTIIRCEGWDKYTRIHLTDGEVFVSSYNIGVFYKQLPAQDFFLSHKSHLINGKHITRYHKEGSITMIDGSVVPVSRRKKTEFIERFVNKVNSISH